MPGISYTGIILTEESKDKLLAQVNIPEGWEVVAHHMTMKIGPLHDEDRALVGTEQIMSVVGICENENVVTVRVQTDVLCANDVKHITVAINKAAGAKPWMSKKVKEHEYSLVQPILLMGKVEEVPNPS